MKKLIYIIILVPLLSRAQQYTRAEIKHEADSILLSMVGQDIFDHCSSELSNDMYVPYKYIDKKGRKRYTEVPRHKGQLTKGRFREVNVIYTVVYPYPKCLTNNVVRGRIDVTLDRNLEMKKSPDVGFIPDYVWAKDSCKFKLRSGL